MLWQENNEEIKNIVNRVLDKNKQLDEHCKHDMTKLKEEMTQILPDLLSQPININATNISGLNKEVERIIPDLILHPELMSNITSHLN